jgi:hypothetical protein
VVEAVLSLSSWRSRFEPGAVVLVMRPSCFGGPVVVNAAASLLSRGCHFEPGAVVFETTSSSLGQGRRLEVRDVACRAGASSTGQCHRFSLSLFIVHGHVPASIPTPALAPIIPPDAPSRPDGGDVPLPLMRLMR